MDAKCEVLEYRVSMLRAVGFVAFAGLAAGFLGIGGGIIVVPVFAAVLGVTMHVSVATSLSAMIFTAPGGSSGHLTLGSVIPEMSLLLAVGVIAGSQVGARLAYQTKKRTLERLFRAVMLFMGLWIALLKLILQPG